MTHRPGHPARGVPRLPARRPWLVLIHGRGHLVPARGACAPAGAARREEEALSSDAAAIRVNSRLSWNFSVEESGRREAEVSQALITIVVDGHRADPEEVR